MPLSVEAGGARPLLPREKTRSAMSSTADRILRENSLSHVRMLADERLVPDKCVPNPTEGYRDPAGPADAQPGGEAEGGPKDEDGPRGANGRRRQSHARVGSASARAGRAGLPIA